MAGAFFKFLSLASSMNKNAAKIANNFLRSMGYIFPKLDLWTGFVCHKNEFL